MPDLDSPLVILGGLYFAGSRQRGRQYTANLSGKNILAGGFADASADWVGSEVSNALGVDAIDSDMGKLLVAGALSRYGDMVPQNNAMSAGMLYNVASGAVSEVGADAESLFGEVTGGNGGSSGSTSASRSSGSVSASSRSSGASVSNGSTTRGTRGGNEVHL